MWIEGVIWTETERLSSRGVWRGCRSPKDLARGRGRGRQGRHEICLRKSEKSDTWQVLFHLLSVFSAVWERLLIQMWWRRSFAEEEDEGKRRDKGRRGQDVESFCVKRLMMSGPLFQSPHVYPHRRWMSGETQIKPVSCLLLSPISPPLPFPTLPLLIHSPFSWLHTPPSSRLPASTSFPSLSSILSSPLLSSSLPPSPSSSIPCLCLLSCVSFACTPSRFWLFCFLYSFYLFWHFWLFLFFFMFLYLSSLISVIVLL